MTILGFSRFLIFKFLKSSTYTYLLFKNTICLNNMQLILYLIRSLITHRSENTNNRDYYMHLCRKKNFLCWYILLNVRHSHMQHRPGWDCLANKQDTARLVWWSFVSIKCRKPDLRITRPSMLCSSPTLPTPKKRAKNTMFHAIEQMFCSEVMKIYYCNLILALHCASVAGCLGWTSRSPTWFCLTLGVNAPLKAVWQVQSFRGRLNLSRRL